jgi:iron(III) transport system ATP-binding protein
MKGAVRFENVTKRYGDVVAVREISFSIDPGKLVTLLGPSGCGKTTTLRMIAGLELASSGRITIGDRDVTRVPASDRDVAMVFQSYALFPHMTVLANVGYGLEAKGMERREAEERAKKSLETVGLTGMESRLPSELSGGQQQRVALARALVLAPEVLLFDEPLSNLDARLRRRMRQEIRDIQQRLGFTAVYVTHDRDEALSISDRIIVMDRAVVVQQGAPRELYQAPATRFVAQFMSEANVLQASLQNKVGDLGEVAAGALLVTLPHRGLEEGPVQLAIRPEAVRLSRPSEPAGLVGRVESCAYLGSHVEYEVSTAAGSILAISSEVDDLLSRGDTVEVGLDRQGAAILPL